MSCIFELHQKAWYSGSQPSCSICYTGIVDPVKPCWVLQCMAADYQSGVYNGTIHGIMQSLQAAVQVA